MSQHPVTLQKSISMVEKGKTSIKVTPGAVIAADCELRGDITIGSRTIIHPKARIIAEAGPIIIGEFNLIEEQASILHLADDTTDPQKQSVMIIGNFNVFEVSSRCEALNVGDHNVIECKAEVGKNIELSNGCIIGCKCQVNCVERLPENTVIYGADCERRVQIEKPQPQTLQIDFLAKIMPNYLRIRKLNKVQKPSPQ